MQRTGQQGAGSHEAGSEPPKAVSSPFTYPGVPKYPWFWYRGNKSTYEVHQFFQKKEILLLEVELMIQNTGPNGDVDNTNYQ